MAIGDSVSDMGPFRCAVGRSLAKWDINGSAVLVNASDEAVAEARRHYSVDITDGRVRVVDRGAPAEDVIAAAGLGLRKVFEPLHEYTEIKRDLDHPDRLNKYIQKYLNYRDKGERHPNLETLKRIRDILESEGLQKPDIMDVLNRYYPEVVVDDVVKNHVINTRIPGDLEAYLQKIGVRREAIKEVLERNDVYHKNRDTAPPNSRSGSTMPPPPPSIRQAAPSYPGEDID
jgi:hypothetical protein